jgi:hypothetical protein
MPFKWLKKLWSQPLQKPDQPVSKSRLPIRVAVESVSPSAISASDDISGNRNAIPVTDTFGKQDGIPSGNQVHHASHPFGRCGFSTGVPEPLSTSGGETAHLQSPVVQLEELFREKIMNADNMEVCLKIIEGVVSKCQEPEQQEEPEPGSEEPAEDCSENFTLWGKRVPGSSANHNPR